MRIRAIDLFCGAGGSSWGARSCGVEIVAGFDSWSLATKVYKENFSSVRVYDRPLESVDPKGIAKKLGKIDLILASPECTNHSLAKGKKRRSNASRNTAFEIVRFARALRPRWLAIENVVTMKQWSRYEEFKAALEEMDYRLSEYVLNAADFGVPQSRRRLFILADNQAEPAKLAAPTHGKRGKARHVVKLNGEYSWNPLITPQRAEATIERAKRARKVVGKRIPFLIVYYGSDYAGGWQRLTAPLRTITTLDRFALVKRKNGKNVMRMLQVPELQAAMGMQGMRFTHGTRRDKIKMIGNAVCPPVMRAVVTTLLGKKQSRSSK